MSGMRNWALALGGLGLAAAGTGPAVAQAGPEPVVLSLTLKDHRFVPDQLSAPAGRPIRIELANQDGALEEFDSDDLKVEKDVTPHGRATISLKPLAPGVYSFMGELHPDTASGTLTVTAQP